MFSNSLDQKPLIVKNGETLRDLSQSMFDFRANNYVTFSAYRIPREYVMRPDLISQAVYNNTKDTEFILKYNGISLPFSINEDDVILIPSLDSAKQNVKTQGQRLEEDSANRIRNAYRYIDPSKKPIKDPGLNEFEKRNDGNKDDARKLRTGALPPNIAEEGSSQITYRNGRVYFGESIGQNACLKNGMSSSEFFTKVIKSKNV